MVLILTLLFYASNTGVIIIDNVWFYGEDHKSRILNTGDLIEIIDEEGELIKTRYDNSIAKLHKDVLINLDEDIGEEMLFVFARGYFETREYYKSTILFDIFIRHFDESIYLAEALYFHGLSYEEIAKNLKDTGGFENIVLNERSNEQHYSGEAYEKILKKFPESIYAPKATYRLIKILRLKNIPWNDSIKLIQEELKAWQNYIKKYKKTDEYALALLEIGYLNRILFQITSKPDYKKDAIKVFEKVINEYPNSVHSANARVNLHEIEIGEQAYYY